ncbi:hypothetical protein MUK42_25141 [Musa troglodytarum]|uniref:Uncharacterized protein n=1 Tax=Musa troglodytarum TaxID=320322 RepID=A0A9E7I7P3_9LILI|nr:hypothetical protein MUK42_25141 [Musa troglodytarum]
MPIAATAACGPSPLRALRPRRAHQSLVCANRVKFARFAVSPTSWELSPPPTHSVPLHKAANASSDASRWRTAASLSGEGVHRRPDREVSGQPSLDHILWAAEVLCVAPSAVFSIWCLVSSVLPGASKPFQVILGSKVPVFQYILLVVAVAIGSLIRWRQWQRIYMANETGIGFDLIRRIEKVEEDLRSSVTIIRVLSRQLEKLGIKFRITRKTLKEPIAETAALSQKNSEATRALAMQEDILEKELSEIQKVLLAMQEQQQKQLELILAIGKAGRLLDRKSDFVGQGRAATNSSVPEKKEQKSQPELQSERHAGEGNDSPSAAHPDFLLKAAVDISRPLEEGVMETLQKLERVQSMLSLMEARGLSSSHRDADRFLADFILFLVQPCGTLTVEDRCRIISDFLPKTSSEVLEEAFIFANKEDIEKKENIGYDLKFHCQQIHTGPSLQYSVENDLDIHLSKIEETPMIGLDAMKRANSTLEDFCRSYFMFHGLDASKPREIFKYLPILSFTESYIYQLDTLNEKALHLSSKVAKSPTTELNNLTHLCNDVTYHTVRNNANEFCCADPLIRLLQCEGLLSDRIRKELNSGIEYWALERKLCHALSGKKKILMEDIMKAIHLKSFDYRVLNLLLCQLGGQEDDVVENSFNILRMFVGIYGASTAPSMLAKCIAEAEEKYERLIRTLDPELSSGYRRRCEEATREGGVTSGHAFGTWNIPPVIGDEESFRMERLAAGGGQDSLDATEWQSCKYQILVISA